MSIVIFYQYYSNLLRFNAFCHMQNAFIVQKMKGREDFSGYQPGYSFPKGTKFPGSWSSYPPSSFADMGHMSVLWCMMSNWWPLTLAWSGWLISPTYWRPHLLHVIPTLHVGGVTFNMWMSSNHDPCLWKVKEGRWIRTLETLFAWEWISRLTVCKNWPSLHLPYTFGFPNITIQGWSVRFSWQFKNC